MLGSPEILAEFALRFGRRNQHAGARANQEDSGGESER
jgi:hypothetical protein